MRADKAEAHASAAHGGAGGRNLAGPGAGAEVRSVAAGETKAEVPGLMEVVVERSNRLCAMSAWWQTKARRESMGSRSLS